LTPRAYSAQVGSDREAKGGLTGHIECRRVSDGFSI
jgi:hypothetical protein